jgi:hypothetical protein
MPGFPPDPGEALPARIAPDRLRRAQLLVKGIRELELDAVSDNVMLAHCLQGVSKAVSDIVTGRKVLDITSLIIAEQLEIPVENVLDYSVRPERQDTSIFMANLSEELGPYLGVLIVPVSGQRKVEREVTIPTDHHIDALLMQEVAFWEDVGTFSRDFRDGGCEMAYPFSSQHGGEDDHRRYLKMLQEFSGELLTATTNT